MQSPATIDPCDGPRPGEVNILIVDDRASNLVALEAVLAPLGHRLVPARSGDEALRQLLATDFAVILMDVHMPGTDGFTAASLIKQRERNRHVPIIFMTAQDAQAEHVQKGYEYGAVDYIVKPFQPDILRSKVSVFVELYLQREQIRRQAALLHEREREAIERRNDLRYQRLIDSMPLSIWGLRTDGEVYYTNRVWQELSGFSAGRRSLDELLAMVHPDDEGALREAWRVALASDHPFELHYRIRSQRDGVFRWHLGCAVPERDEHGRVMGWIVTATDIDDQKAAAAELARAVAARDEFLATAGHELRTPLTSLQLAVQGLLRSFSQGARPLLPEQITVKLKTIAAMAKRQAKLIEDLLDVSRLAVGRLDLELEDVDLMSVVSEVAARFEDELRLAGCPFELTGAPVVGCWDRTRLDQIITNLLSNAAKYGAGHPIVLRVEADDTHGRVLVLDQGIGIAAEDQARIFERFARAVADRSYGGFGLGLWISRQLAEALGGAIRVSSTPGKGSTFTVELPLDGPELDR
jgi:PAS domain S-box-containing protein